MLKENPRHPLALCNLGFVFASQNQTMLAESYYDQALALDPDYQQALLNKAAIRIFNNDKKTARQLLQRVLQINPANSEALKVLNSLSR